MKNLKIVSLLFMVLLLVGCNKEVLSICKKTETLDSGEVIVTTDTTKYDKNYIVISGFTDDETFNMKKKIYDETAKTINNTSDNYKYEVNEKDKTFKITLIIDNYADYTFFSEEEKKNNLGIKNRVKTSENSGYTCEIIGTSRKAIGLE